MHITSCLVLDLMVLRGHQTLNNIFPELCPRFVLTAPWSSLMLLDPGCSLTNKLQLDFNCFNCTQVDSIKVIMWHLMAIGSHFILVRANLRVSMQWGWILMQSQIFYLFIHLNLQISWDMYSLLCLFKMLERGWILMQGTVQVEGRRMLSRGPNWII